MKRGVRIIFFSATVALLGLSVNSFSQNVGIGTATPSAKLHVKGTADTSQLLIDANSTQSSTRPLIRLRKSSGTDLMWINSDDSSNVFIGLNAGRVNNVSVLATDNTFIGSNAGYSNNAGNGNTVTGSRALYSNVSGNNNTASGSRALYANTTGSSNTATGSYALYSNTTGYVNTATGFSSLSANTTGIYNTAVGPWSLGSNTTGNYNTAVGARSLGSNTTGNYNTANGTDALQANFTGYNNTAMGSNALFDNSSGIENAAFGGWSLNANQGGNFNTALGLGALYATTGSTNNTAVGCRAGDNYNMGWNNTLIGANSDVSTHNIFNSVAIGESAITDANNKVRIGNTFITSIGGQVGWSNFSDGRYKQQVEENIPGIAFIKKLRPVSYTVDIKGLNENYYKLQSTGNVNYTLQRQTGLIAQEVEKAANEMGFAFSGIDKPETENGLYGLRYAEFVVPLIKAVQELSKQNEELKNQLASEKKQNEELLTRVEKLERIIINKNNQ